MTMAEVFAIVIGAGLVTAGASHIVFRSFGVELRRRHQDVGTTVFLQLGVIYAVFLAFVFGQALTSFVAADDSIDAECAALHGAAIIGRALTPPARKQLATAFHAYIDAVVTREWPAMHATRRGSPEALLREEDLVNLANTLDAGNPKETRTQEQMVTLLIEAHRNREERLFQAGQGIPDGFWAMILVYCVCLVAFVAFSSLELATSHAIVGGIFGSMNTLVLLAVFLLQYPFEGPFELSPKSFVVTGANIAVTLGR